MVFNAFFFFYYISVISWRSVLLVEEIKVPREKTIDLSQVTDNLDHIMYQVHLATSRILTLNFSGNRQIAQVFVNKTAT